MVNKEKILQIVRENKGFVTASQVSEAKVSPGSLKYLVDVGVLERSSRGVYLLPGVPEDKFYNLQTRYKKGTFSGETALFLHEISYHEPTNIYMTFPLNYHTASMSAENIKCWRVKEENYDLGITILKTPRGNPVRVYKIERTLCDILKVKDHTNNYIVTKALKQYLNSEQKNLDLLLEYAKKLRVEKKLRPFLKISGF